MTAATATAASVDVRVDPTQLSRFLRVARRAAPGRAAFPVLSGVKIATAGDDLEVEASDLATTLTARLDCWHDGDGLNPAATVVSRAALARGLSALPDLPTVLSIPTGDEPWLTLTAGPAEIRRRAMSAVVWPTLYKADTATDHAALLEPADVDRLRAVAGAASTDEGRPVLCGVHLDGASAATTDSYRLYVEDLDASLPGLLLPAHAIAVVTEQARNTDVQVTVDAEQNVTFRWRRHDIAWALTTRPIQGTFPDYRALIPTDATHRFDVDRVALAGAVRRHGQLLHAEGRNHPLRLMAVKKRLHLSYEAAEVVGGEQLDIEWPTDDVLAFNPQFLLEALTSLPDDTVTVEIRDGLKPMVLRAGGSFRLLMPMRTN